MMRVVDLSSWQAGFDFRRAATEGIEGVVIKRSGGKSYKNPYFRNMVAEAQAAGLEVAAYAYLLEPTGDPGEPEDEADFFCDSLPTGWPYPVAPDVEETNRRFPNLSDYVQRWKARVRARLGTKTEFLYTGNYFVQEQNLKDPALGDSLLWLASWQDDRPPVPHGGPWTDYKLWQYGSRATVGGMTPIDVNWFYGDRAEWRSYGAGGTQLQVVKPSVGTVTNPGKLPPAEHEIHPYFWAAWDLGKHGYPLGPGALYDDGRIRQLFENCCLSSRGRDEPQAYEGLGQAYVANTGRNIVDWPDIHPLLP
jgi:GH25 family lysozyme M1 (1,4-beta-N-acetylmuramidase)